MADLDHIFHPYHKLSYKKVVKRADNNRMVCKACVDEISSEHYSCEECKFFLHKLCAQRPSELTHSLHPQHPLRLLHYYRDLNVYCDSCGKRVDGFIYHCEICKFSLDFICAFPDGRKLNHVCHPDHVLTYEDEVKRDDDKGAVCAACLEEISLERYSCGACHFHLHKACAERPLKLKHPLHPYHDLDLRSISSLRLWTSKTIFCDACGKRVKGFVYHCHICCFDLDFLCAFSGHSKFYHVCHPQHVLTLGNKAKKERVVCAACLEEISGQSAQYYSCRPCNFFLHKVCAVKPQWRIDYPHTSDLELIPKTNNVDAQCDVCKNRLEGFVYRSRHIPFQVDFACSFPDDDSELKHVCHPGHKFTRENVVKRTDKALNCAACLEEISGPLADYYSCRKCNFFLHGLCFQRPWELTTPLHPEHPLRLLDEDPYPAGTGYCKGCQKSMKGFVYVCQECSFCLDFICAFPKEEMHSLQSFDNVHHHPLMFLPRPAKFSCDVCSSKGDGSNEEEDQSFVCSIPTCNFWIHKKCALITLTRQYKGHKHPLSLVQGLPEDLQIYRGLYCDVCRQIVYPTDWISYCDRCKYFVHVRCMTTDETKLMSSIKDGVDYLHDSFIKLLLNGEEFVHWPLRDISAELIHPFLVGKDTTMDIQPFIRHFSHKQHYMTLFEELCVNSDSFFQVEDEEILCDACIQPITAPYFCCPECNYYLHLACSMLPSQIEHESHPHHKLDLTFQERFYTTFRCDRCKWLCNGFRYECARCNFELDLTCAALPTVILHETHEHPLFQMEAKDDGRCYASGRAMPDGSLIFKCIYCNVYISYSYAMLSRSIRHRWDRNHPIDLKFPPHDHPDHFMCDMCETLIHPKYWLYSCFQCKISFHASCKPRIRNMKFGGKLRISSHAHPLKFLFEPTLKSSCVECGNRFDYCFTFECETCYVCLCPPCAYRSDEAR